MISAKSLIRLPDALEIARYLRTCTYLINDRNSYRKPFTLKREKVPLAPEDISDGYKAEALENEVHNYWTKSSDSTHFQAVPGRIFRVESEIDVQN